MDRWRRIEALFDEAVKQPPSDRDAYLRRACAQDLELYREVTSLLSHDADGTNDESWAARAAEALLEERSRSPQHSPSNSSLAPGMSLGPYRITGVVGAGAMGEVYRARDSHLNRDVALKVLPGVLARDPDRLARLRREAQVLASLNHQNIAAIYGFEDRDGIQALVLEFVDGPTLAQRIAHGPLPLDQALPIAKQIAEALEAAHEHGIIHRDLKPANIKVQPDGTVKLLDFGLAKALDPIPSTSDVSPSPPLPNHELTDGGAILGTWAYMSPEQARGVRVDRRTDIWAFGCVLYEMLTGRRAFGAGTSSEMLAKVLEGHADLHALPASTPPAIRRVIRRCLERPLRSRMQHIGDALADIVDARVGEPDLTAQRVATKLTPRRRALVWAAAGIGLVMLGGAGAWFVSSRVAPAATTAIPVRFDVLPVQAPPPGLDSRTLALSPDGTRLVYTSLSSLRLRPIGGDDVPLPGVGRDPFFSPDSQWVAFFSNDGLQRLPIGGGALELLTPATGIERTFGGTWGPDGTIVFSLGSRLMRVSAKGSPLESIAQPETARGEVRYAWPEFLPDGRSVLFTIVGVGGAADAKIAVLDVMTRRKTTVLQGGHAARYLSSGHLLYASQGQFHAVGFDERRLQTRGAPVSVAGMNIAETLGGFNANFAVAHNGTLAYLPPTGPSVRTLAWVDRDGREEAIPAPPMAYVYPRISPDGTRVALDVLEGNRDIWVGNLANGIVTKITNGPTEDLMPAWSPDSTRVFFGSDREGGAFKVYSVAADGAGSERQEFGGQGNYVPLSMPGPDQLLAGPSGAGRREGDIALVTIGRGGQSQTLLGMEGAQGNAQVSPDGRWIAYQSSESGVLEVYVRSYPDVDRRREQISRGGGIQPLWGRAGSNELFYSDLKGVLKVVSVTTAADFRVVGASRDVPLGEGVIRPRAGSAWRYAVSPVDGRLLIVKVVPGSGAAVPYQVHVNWHEELKRLVPAL